MRKTQILPLLQISVGVCLITGLGRHLQLVYNCSKIEFQHENGYSVLTVMLVTTLIRLLYDGDGCKMLLAEKLVTFSQHLKAANNTNRPQHSSPTSSYPTEFYAPDDTSFMTQKYIPEYIPLLEHVKQGFLRPWQQSLTMLCMASHMYCSMNIFHVILCSSTKHKSVLE